MIISSRLTKIVLTIALVFSLSTPVHAKGIYPVLDRIGSITDWVLSRGKLEEKYEKMFQEVAASLGIADREVKARNSGLFFRLAFGYQNALAFQPTNRVYLNEDFLRELGDDEVKFLMAHELTHHRNHDALIFGITAGMLASIQTNIMSKQRINGTADSYLDRYLARGWTFPLLPQLSARSLVEGQIHQHCETRADTQAVTVAGADPEAGARLMENIYDPETKNWPLYARFNQFFLGIMLKVYALPIIKSHAPHLASCKERVAHILSLKVVKQQAQDTAAA